MQRKELFSAVRDEQGDLVVYFPESDMAIEAKKKFWKEALTMIEDSLKSKDTDLFEDLGPVQEAVKIIKKCLEDW